MGSDEFRRIKGKAISFLFVQLPVLTLDRLVFMLRYLELKQVLERPKRRATPPMEMPTPIRTDTSFLYANWPGSRRSSSPQSKTGESISALAEQNTLLIAISHDRWDSVSFPHFAISEPKPLANVILRTYLAQRPIHTEQLNIR